MLSFREAAKKRVPPHDTVDMAALAQQMNISRPVSLIALLNDLNSFLPDFKVFDSGPLGPSTTTGWGQVGFTIDGGVAFRGSVHESGFLGHNYTFAMAVANYRDSAGNLVVFVHSGSVEGTDPATSGLHPRRDDSWNGNGTFDSFVSEHWDSIKSSPWHANLEVDTNPGEVIQLVVRAVIAAGAVGRLAAFIVAVISSGGADTTWGQDPETGQPTLFITPKRPQH